MFYLINWQTPQAGTKNSLRVGSKWPRRNKTQTLLTGTETETGAETEKKKIREHCKRKNLSSWYWNKRKSNAYKFIF